MKGKLFFRSFPLFLIILSIEKISCPPVLLSKILNSLVKNSTFKRIFSLFFIPPQKIITKFSPVCSVLNFLINKSKEILTFVDSIESQQNKYIRKSFLKIFYENTCASLKNVITLQPQTRNEPRSQERMSRGICKRTMTYCHRTKAAAFS